MSSLKEILQELSYSFSPIPPPLNITVDEKAPTFNVDLVKMLVTAPGYHGSLKHLRELIGHEIKHASGDGLPYTWKNELWFEAALMKSLDKPLSEVRGILNVVYDAVVDLRVAAEGLDVKGACEEWLKRFPVTPEAEGSSYHLLQILYKDFFKIKLPNTKYERHLRTKMGSLYRNLKEAIRRLSSGEGDRNTVIEAAVLVDKLSRSTAPLHEDVFIDRGNMNVRAEAAEIGIEMGLSDEQLAQLMGVGVEELNEKIEEAAEDKVRAAMWRGILGFKEISAAASMLEVKEHVPERWKPYSRNVDPRSVMKHPDDPRKWRVREKETVMLVEQEGDSGGFTKVVMLLDCSGSTGCDYSGRTVLSYIKDAAYGLLAYAKQLGLPVLTIAFNTAAWVLGSESRDYIGHGKKIFKLRPEGSTNLRSAVNLAGSKGLERSLLVLITDGLVDPNHMREFSKRSRVSRAVVAVVNADARGIETVKTADPSVQIFVVRPDALGRTVISSLPRKGA